MNSVNFIRSIAFVKIFWRFVLCILRIIGSSFVQLAIVIFILKENISLYGIKFGTFLTHNTEILLKILKYFLLKYYQHCFINL